MLQFHHVSGAFILWGIGIGFSAIVFILEIFWYYLVECVKRSKHPKHQIIQVEPFGYETIFEE